MSLERKLSVREDILRLMLAKLLYTRNHKDVADPNSILDLYGERLLGAVKQNEKSDVLLRRYGFYGAHARAMHRIAKHRNVSTAAVNSLLSTHFNRSLPHCFDLDQMPALRLLRDLLASAVPIAVDEASKAFEPLLDGVDMVDVARFCSEVMGQWIAPVTTRSEPLSLVLGTQIVLEDEGMDDEELIHLIQLVKCAVRNQGVCSVHQFIDVAPDGFKDEAVLAKYLSLYAWHEWIDDEHKWFWHSERQKNALRTVAHRLLAVSRTGLSTHDFQQALSHYQRQRRTSTAETPLPTHVIELFLKKIDGIERLSDGLYRINHTDADLTQLFDSVDLCIIDRLAGAQTPIALRALAEPIGLTENAVRLRLMRSQVISLTREGARLRWQDTQASQEQGGRVDAFIEHTHANRRLRA